MRRGCRRDAAGAAPKRPGGDGGAHFRHWLQQFKEIYEEDDFLVEEEDPTAFACFEQAGEKMYSVWRKILKEGH